MEDQDGDDQKYENYEAHLHHKVIDKFIFLHYQCNDKDIIFLMENNDEIRIENIPAIKAMDFGLISVCNVYKNMPSELDIIQQVFRMHDVYGFGEIDKKEFNKFLSALTVNTDISKTSSSRLFEQIDQDKIKNITFNQFAKFMIENKKVLWTLLLELAKEYDLGKDLELVLYQTTLSKIHKMTLIMYEMYELLLVKELFSNNIGIWEDKLFRYISYIESNQKIIDQKMVQYKIDKNDEKKVQHKSDKKCKKNIKYLRRASKFIHNNMPNID